MTGCYGGGETSQTIDGSYFKGPGARNGKEREILSLEPVYMSDRKGHNGITENGTASTLTSQEKERPVVGCCDDDDNEIPFGEERKIGNTIVRRLTPTECMRLQGYPDGWLDIGEYVNSKGRLLKPTDTAKYKAAGNSIALPFWEWLSRRIVSHYESTVTMGSLFDGIGGFPLVFSRCGASPVWASEIEDFPIAVTKYHFPEQMP